MLHSFSWQIESAARLGWATIKQKQRYPKLAHLIDFNIASMHDHFMKRV